MTEEQLIKQILAEHGGGTYEEHYGDFAFGDRKIWEIWAKNNGRYETRFLVGELNQNPIFFEDFASLCNQMNIWNNTKKQIFNHLPTSNTDIGVPNEVATGSIDPTTMTIGMLMSNMKPSTLWSVLAALVGVLSAVAVFAYKIGSISSFSH